MIHAFDKIVYGQACRKRYICFRLHQFATLLQSGDFLETRLITPFGHALPVSESLFHEPLYLTHAGWEIVAPGASYPPDPDSQYAPVFAFDLQEGRTLPEFCLAFVAAGSGEMQVADYRGTLSAGEAFFFRPGEWHRHRPLTKTGWTIMWIHFHGSLPLQWMRDGLFHLHENKPVIEVPSLFLAQFEHLLESIHQAPSTNSLSYSGQVIGLLSHFLVNRPTDSGERATRVEDEAAKSAVEYIWNFSHGIVDVSAVVDKVGIPRRTLERRFKTATGHSIMEEIQFCQVSRAARLLEETTIPIKQIVQRAGFRDDEQLRLAFQKSFGKSAQAYRNERRATG